MSDTRPTRWVRNLVEGLDIAGAGGGFGTVSNAACSPLEIGETLRRVFIQGTLQAGMELPDGNDPPDTTILHATHIQLGVWVDTTADVFTPPGPYSETNDDPSWALRVNTQQGTIGSWKSALGTSWALPFYVPQDGLSDSHTNRGPASGAGASIFLSWDIFSIDGNWWELDGTSGIKGWLWGSIEVHQLIESAASS